MIHNEQLREYIIKPVLNMLQMYSDDAVELLVFTCAVESDGGTYVKQIQGPALGIFQMEPKTYTDIWQNYIRSRSNLTQLMGLHFDAYRMPDPERMIYDLRFATAMARLHYRRSSLLLPNRKDVDAIWNYYKQIYNTPAGKADKGIAIKKYQAFLQLGKAKQVKVQPQPESVQIHPQD